MSTPLTAQGPSSELDAQAAALALTQAPFPLVECPLDLDPSRPHRTVLQRLGGATYRWREYPLAEHGATCILEIAPRLRALAVEQAALLLASSRAGASTASDATGSAIDTSSAVSNPEGRLRAATPRAAPRRPLLPERTLEELVRASTLRPGTVRRRLHESMRTVPRSAVATPPAESLVFGSDDRVRVQNTTVSPWSAVAYVESTFPSGNVYGVSGFLAGPYTVLTSALAVYDEAEGGWAESVLVVPGQSQVSEGSTIVEPFGSQFAEFIEVPQSWIDDGDAGSLYGAVLLAEPFAGLPEPLPVVFDSAPGGVVTLAGYDQFAQGESNSFAQWRRSGSLEGIDAVFFDHRMDDDGGTLGAPVWEQVSQSVRRVFGLNCCNSADQSTNAGVRFTSQNEALITDWVLYEPDGGGGGGGGGGPLDPVPLLLGAGRFEVTAVWRNPQNERGVGSPVPLTGDTGYFWFFRPDNVELVVKVLDACSQAQPRFWVFAAGLTNVEVELEVLDTDSGATWSYFNPRGTAFPPVQDTDAFRTCP